ncbi:MAG: hypothetical protein PHD11_01445 [Bacteroidales bacterium]|nr:hypothetical protein [Bacteroidales bacterium]
MIKMIISFHKQFSKSPLPQGGLVGFGEDASGVCLDGIDFVGDIHML